MFQKFTNKIDRDKTNRNKNSVSPQMLLRDNNTDEMRQTNTREQTHLWHHHCKMQRN